MNAIINRHIADFKSIDVIIKTLAALSRRIWNAYIQVVLKNVEQNELHTLEKHVCRFNSTQY